MGTYLGVFVIVRLILPLLVGGIFVSAGAEISVESVRQSPFDYACTETTVGVLSKHQRLDKAAAACLERELNDPSGQYEVHGGRWRIEVTKPAQAAVVTVSNPPPSTGGDPTADFQSRVTAPDVLYATNFDDVYLNGSLNVARSGISSTTELTAEAHETPGDDQYIWDSGTKISGAGALRLTCNSADAGGTPAS